MLDKNEIVPRALVIALLLTLCVVSGALIGTAASLLQTSTTVSNTGSVNGVGVGIYWNSACTNQTSSINWGSLNPGSNETLGIYVMNDGNTAITLSMTVQNWNPSTAQSYMSLNWNYSSQTLSVNQVLPVSLTLTVSSTVSGITSFSFNVTITATS